MKDYIPSPTICQYLFYKKSDYFNLAFENSVFLCFLAFYSKDWGTAGKSPANRRRIFMEDRFSDIPAVFYKIIGNKPKGEFCMGVPMVKNVYQKNFLNIFIQTEFV